MSQGLTCTLVTGYATGSNQYIPKSVLLDANGTQGYISWFPEDFPGEMLPNSQYSVSCNLMPGVGLNDVYMNATEFVGA